MTGGRNRSDLVDSLILSRENSERTSLWVGQRHGDALGNSDLVELKIGVSRDDSTGREVYTLAHEVTAEPTLLALESGANSLNRAARLLECLRNTGDVVVHVGRDVVLREGEQIP